MSDTNSAPGCGLVGYFGMVIAALVSYSTWHSIGWALVNAFFGWFYVVYYMVRYGWPNL